MSDGSLLKARAKRGAAVKTRSAAHRLAGFRAIKSLVDAACFNGRTYYEARALASVGREPAPRTWRRASKRANRGLYYLTRPRHVPRVIIEELLFRSRPRDRL